MKKELREVYLSQVKDERISEHTHAIYKDEVVKVKLNKDFGIDIIYKTDGMKWIGSLQGIELDEQGETVGYYVYVY
jgi:hypothetical protein